MPLRCPALGVGVGSTSDRDQGELNSYGIFTPTLHRRGADTRQRCFEGGVDANARQVVPGCDVFSSERNSVWSRHSTRLTGWL